MTDQPKSLMLFAAGFGTRMGDLTRDLPKPMIQVAGRPLIDHALSLTEEVKGLSLVANLHYKPQALIDHLSPKGVAFSVEQPDILETGGGLLAALPLLGSGPVFTLNTDAIWSGPNPLTLLADHWDPEKMDALMICVPLANAIGHAGKGDFRMAPNGELTRGPGLIYGGAQIIRTDLLPRFQQAAFSLNLVWDEMLKSRRLFGLLYPGKWCDVGHPEGIKNAEDLLEYRYV